METVRPAGYQLVDLLHVAARLLDGDNVAGLFGKFQRSLRLHVDSCPARYVIQNDRYRRGIRDRSEMFVQPTLRRTVVKRRHTEYRVHPCEVEIMQSGHDGSRIVASYPRNQRQTTGIAAFDTFENGLALGRRESRGFGRSTESHQIVHTAGCHIVYQCVQSRKINRSVILKRGNQSNPESRRKRFHTFIL